MNETFKLRVAVDACSLGRERTGVGNYIYDILHPLCETETFITWFLFSNAEISFPDLPNVVMRPNCGRARGVVWHNFVLPKHLRDNGIDVFWGANGFIPLIDITEIGTIVTIHDLVHYFCPDTSQPLVRWSRRVFQPLSAKKADLVLCNSDATAQDVRRIYGVESWAIVRPNIPSIFVPPSVEEIAAIREKYDLPDGFILVVGTLEPRKNLPEFLRAIIDCQADGVELPIVVHAGGCGWLAEETNLVIKQAEKFGLFRRLGFVPKRDLPALYGCCTAFCMPSIYEGFGIPVAEAMSCGATVMHGDHPSMIEAARGRGLQFEPTRAGMVAFLKSFASNVFSHSKLQVNSVDPVNNHEILLAAIAKIACNRGFPYATNVCSS